LVLESIDRLLINEKGSALKRKGRGSLCPLIPFHTRNSVRLNLDELKN
jgi:hypothetical protein